MIKTKKYILEGFDRYVEKKANGFYTVSSNKDSEIFKVRNAVEYCHKNNKDISKLSDEEMRLFVR